MVKSKDMVTLSKSEFNDIATKLKITNRVAFEVMGIEFKDEVKEFWDTLKIAIDRLLVSNLDIIRDELFVKEEEK